MSKNKDKNVIFREVKGYLMIKKIIQLVLVLCMFLISGCGGGGGGSGTTTSEQKAVETSTAITSEIATVSLSETSIQLYEKVSSLGEASSFLARATFGPTMKEIEGLLKQEDYNQWIETQFTQTPSYHIEWAETNAKGIDAVGNLKDNPEDWRTYSDSLAFLQRDAWWDIAVFGNDQLRQRVAFALSEIMVISKFGALINSPDSRMSYYDVLVKNAFGNFETLLQDVTYHPAMGRYLSYLGNAKANTDTGSHPDENYAREVMQLFTIGLYELNLDGSKKTDSSGNMIATYTQNDIEEMAKVFTGLTDDNDNFFSGDGSSTHHSRTSPMISVEEYHDTSEKSIFGKTIGVGGTTETDIKSALNILFNHANTAPFIAKRLIQRLVTSNPSPAYIKYVASAFNDNGQGVRGDMKAVVKAILLYKEDTASATFGKLREPLLFVSNLFRAFDAQKSKNILYQGSDKVYEYSSFNFHGTGYTKQEGALEALTVFNYFTPEDAPDNLKKEGLAAPEFKLFGTSELHQLLMGLINKDKFIYETHEVTAELQLEDEETLLKNKKYDELLNRLDILLLGGKMDSATKAAIKEYMIAEDTITAINSYLNDEDTTDKTLTFDNVLTRHVISLVMTSPDFAIQR